MIKTPWSIFCIAFLAMLLGTGFVKADHTAKTISLKVAAIDWCPQICPDQQDQGYIIDILDQIFASGPYNLEIEYSPWTRAIKLVDRGDYHALLAPMKAEAPSLLYPDHAIGAQRMCFFTLQDS